MSTPCAPESSAAVDVFDPRRLYAVADVVDRTQMSRSTVYKAMQAGGLPYFKRGATRRLLGADLNAFLTRYYLCGR